MQRICAVLLFAAACGSHGGNGSGGDDDGGGGGGDAGVPIAVCTAFTPVDVSSPTTTIGSGTPDGCTQAALQAAATTGGTIVFACGASPITIPITQTITIPNETVIDGSGLVTLDGGGATRILYLDSSYNATTPRLTVQNLAFHAGLGPGSGDDTARGGGAIYRNGGSLTVIDSTFDDNHAGATGQDLAGGAIYGFGGGETVISGSTFTSNSASNGGAVGSLNGNLTIVNSTFTGNAATGSGGNPGDGGCGGAIYMDGTHEATSLCGLAIANNQAGAIGGGFFRVSNDGTGTFAMDRTTVDGNTVTPAASGNAGGLYLEGLAIDITASTISNNAGAYCGGIWIDMGTADLTNVTIAGNTATASNGGGMWLANSPSGSLLNCTIANNQAVGSGVVSGAIFGTGLTAENTIIANNTAQYDPSCQDPLDGSSGNVQWPSGSPCSMSPTVADPLLGALGSNGGPTATLLPGSGSPAADLGTSDCPATDQRGNPRATPCTAGAVELP